MKNQIIIATAITTLCIASSASAAVTFVGSIVDDAGNEATRWDSSSVTKTLDADGNNAYGSYTAEFIGVVNRNNTPGPPAVGKTLSYVSHTGAVTSPNLSYVTIDNGVGGSANANSITSSGLLSPADNLANIITYQFDGLDIATIAPNGVRIGAFTDGLDGAQYTGDHYTLEHLRSGSVIGTATVDLTANNSFDAHFFDVTGIQTGDQIRFATAYDGNPAATYATLQGFTADIIAVPEPSSAALLGLGSLALILRRRI